MISSASRPYIDASVPVLRQHGLAITTVFYRNLFAELPALTNLFNMGNQANGSQQQSLASAVFAYAANIDNPGALGPVVSRIVHKHVSIGVRAEHYPIVGRHLLAAIAEVLGDAATAPLLAAWEEAYGALANIFIAAEQEMYTQAAAEPGQTRAMTVIGLTQQSDEVLSVTLAPADGSAAPAFKAGQYLSCHVDLDDGTHQIRQYSLSDAPNGNTLRISVKREPEGAARPAGAVSNWIHHNLKPGMTLAVSNPYGDFTPDSESHEPVVLLSAGVGITPMIATLNRIARVNPGRHVIFAHAARNARHHAHRDDVAAAQKRMPNLQVITFYQEGAGEAGVKGGLMDAARLPSWPRTETDVFMCGPTGFMKQQWKELLALGVPAAKLHREVFGPEALDHLL